MSDTITPDYQKVLCPECKHGVILTYKDFLKCDNCNAVFNKPEKPTGITPDWKDNSLNIFEDVFLILKSYTGWTVQTEKIIEYFQHLRNDLQFKNAELESALQAETFAHDLTKIDYKTELRNFEKRMELEEDEYDSIAERFMDISDCLKSREHGYNQVIQLLKQEVKELKYKAYQQILKDKDLRY